MSEISVYVKDAIAQNQARLFEYVTKQGYDTEDFAEKFMRSNFCESDWDALYSPYQLWDVCFTLEFLLRETDIKYNNNGNTNIAHWIGWIYRKIFYILDKKSKEIIEVIPYKKMVTIYPGFHTIDEYNVCEILKEDFFS